jgi:Na+-driven multidrug efflux pump
VPVNAGTFLYTKAMPVYIFPLVCIIDRKVREDFSVNKDYTIDMCNGAILKKMLVFTIPLMLSSILQLLFNAADIIVVGRFAGDNSLAAVGSTSALINLLTN